MTDHRTEALRTLEALTADLAQAGVENWADHETGFTIALRLGKAQTHAILAIADALNQPAAGTCTAVYHVTIFAPHDTATYGCRHPHGHTGAHQDRNRTTTWLDTAHGAYHLDDPEPASHDTPHHPTDDTTTIPAPTGLCPSADTTHTSNETVIHGCTLTYRHDGPHTSGTTAPTPPAPATPGTTTPAHAAPTATPTTGPSKQPSTTAPSPTGRASWSTTTADPTSTATATHSPAPEPEGHPMSTFDLNEARRLHDRDPDNPTACATCAGAPHPEYETPQMAPWPCHTDRALGATGNSEWTGPDDLTRRLEAAMHPDITGAGIFTIPKIITFNPDTERVLPDGRVITTMCSTTLTDSENHLIGGACTLDTAHGGPHQSPTHRWTREDHPRYPSITNRTTGTACPEPLCIRFADHTGPHVNTHAHEWPNPGPRPICGHRDPNSTATCNRTHGHTSGPHTSGNGTTQWSTDPCRFDSINLPGGKWCILNRGHHGPCRFEHKGTQIHRCTTTGGTNSTLTCALATGHRTDNPHTTINGTEWDTND